MSLPTILHLCSIKGRGGTGYMASRLCRLCSEEGARVIVGACPESKMEERARKAGLETIPGLALRRGFRPVDLAGDLRRIRHYINKYSIDVVHTWHSIEYWTGALAVLGTKAALVRTRGLVTPVASNLVNRIIHNRTAFVHVTCKDIEDNYRAAGFDMSRVHLVHDGVDIKRFHPGAGGRELRASLGLSPEAVVLASVGRLEPVKGHEIMLAAVAQVAGKIPDLHVLIAGDGSQREKLTALAADLGVSEKVHFLGVRSDIPAILDASDFYVLSSLGSEGSSRATLEAMATGKAVIASAVGMLPDIVREGSTGYLVEPDNVQALAERLRRLARDRDLSSALGLNARALVEDEYDERLFARRILELYTSECQAAP